MLNDSPITVLFPVDCFGAVDESWVPVPVYCQVVVGAHGLGQIFHPFIVVKTGYGVVPLWMLPFSHHPDRVRFGVGGDKAALHPA